MTASVKFSYAQLGKALKIVREIKGYKQEYVSVCSGIDQSLYSRFENDNAHMSLDRFLAVCDVLDVSPLLLLYCAGYTKAYPFEQTIQKETDFIKNVLERINNGGGGK